MSLFCFFPYLGVGGLVRPKYGFIHIYFFLLNPSLITIFLIFFNPSLTQFFSFIDLLEMGIDVHIPIDCVSSRSNFDRKVALERLKQSGAFLTSCEAVILGMAPDAKHPKFKGIQKLVMEPSLDTGL